MKIKQSKIHKVTNITMWGHEEDTQYFKSPIDAEKEFHKRVKSGITSEELPERDGSDDPPPWKVRIGSGKEFTKKDIKLMATIRFWDSYHTDCGTEHDVNEYEIVFEEIEVA